MTQFTVYHKKSNQATDGKPKLPTQEQLKYGEIAINYGENIETISIKNSANDIVTFSADNITDKKIQSKQDLLKSGTNIKTINGSSILGSGNIDVTVDTSSFATKTELQAKADKQHSHNLSDVQNINNSWNTALTNKLGTYWDTTLTRPLGTNWEFSLGTDLGTNWQTAFRSELHNGWVNTLQTAPLSIQDSWKSLLGSNVDNNWSSALVNSLHNDWLSIFPTSPNFAPKTHTHTVSQITDLQGKLDAKADKTAISDMLTKTEASTTYAPTYHGHDIGNISGIGSLWVYQILPKEPSANWATAFSNTLDPTWLDNFKTTLKVSTISNLGSNWKNTLVGPLGTRWGNAFRNDLGTYWDTTLTRPLGTNWEFSLGTDLGTNWQTAFRSELHNGWVNTLQTAPLSIQDSWKSLLGSNVDNNWSSALVNSLHNDWLSIFPTSPNFAPKTHTHTASSINFGSNWSSLLSLPLGSAVQGGLTASGSHISASVGTCLEIDTANQISIRLGTGLLRNANNKLCVNLGTGLTSDGQNKVAVQSTYAQTNVANTWTAYQDFTAGAGNSGSDMRFKEVKKETIENVLPTINQIQIFPYIWKKQGETSWDTFGVDADQLIKLGGIFEKMVHERNDNEKTKFVDYERFGLIAVKAIQELNNKIDKLIQLYGNSK